METALSTTNDSAVAGYLTVQQVADILGRHPQTIRRGIHAGRIQARRFASDNSPFLIPREEVQRIQREGTITQEVQS